MGVTYEIGFVGVPLTLRHIFILEVSVYDIAAGVWYSEPTTSRTNTFLESRYARFCAGAVAALDKASFTIYIYGGYDLFSHKKGTWALKMPYFQ
ncbi:hypothetical protein HOY80DRAFT_1140805 [Tuber brumale]|nr:hypothetical protein HOY80DRAFT_1140805 [Tuber brumale]